MGCSEFSNTKMKKSVEGTSDIQGINALLMNDDGLSNLLELHIECKNLKNLDTFSKSDPLVAVTTSNRNKLFLLVYTLMLEGQKE